MFQEKISISRFDNREMIIAKVVFLVIRFLQEHSSSLLYPHCFTATAESSMFIHSIVLFNNNLGVDLS